ncbi:MC112 [Molluscum contagiosum virus subtype 2]|uniref:MC112 n=2 Tax=Molluscum contagiosum virus TaxID=10279 RepID=A0A1S7DLV4_MCV2|nr:MC112 [Molluscum contagiosum virus subtype 2]QHW16500.1 MC112L [Molluscum contagiosum virus]AYO87747.1 MC112 [Molluscum contagiosum virus subtype 2]AYO87917.1 MC112 [Molluscum contagiosum virus subtype 2]AYO88087.1 MC112 [Molluscum contagiosum virus subtype 2]
MSCAAAILKSIGGLALFQVANGAIEMLKHCLMYFYEQRLRANSFAFVVIKIGLSMLLYLVLGLALLYVSSRTDTARAETPGAAAGAAVGAAAGAAVSSAASAATSAAVAAVADAVTGAAGDGGVCAHG